MRVRRREGEEEKEGEQKGRQQVWAERAVGAVILSQSIILSKKVISFFNEGVGSLHYSIYHTNSLYCKLYTILYVPSTILYILYSI